MKNTSSQPDKKMVYSIRSLKNGTGSVLQERAASHPTFLPVFPSLPLAISLPKAVPMRDSPCPPQTSPLIRQVRPLPIGERNALPSENICLKTYARSAYENGTASAQKPCRPNAVPAHFPQGSPELCDRYVRRYKAAAHNGISRYCRQLLPPWTNPPVIGSCRGGKWHKPD